MNYKYIDFQFEYAEDEVVNDFLLDLWFFSIVWITPTKRKKKLSTNVWLQYFEIMYAFAKQQIYRRLLLFTWSNIQRISTTPILVASCPNGAINFDGAVGHTGKGLRHKRRAGTLFSTLCLVSRSYALCKIISLCLTKQIKNYANRRFALCTLFNLSL